MWNGRVLEGNQNHLRAGEFAAATDGVRDFSRLAQTDPDASLFVAHDHQRAETEATAALDDLGGTVDEHNLLDQFFARAKPPVAFAGRFTTATRTAARSALSVPTRFIDFSHSIYSVKILIPPRAPRPPAP